MTTVRPLCWWCRTDEATTGEHMIKASVVREDYGRRWSPATAPILVTSERPKLLIQGPGSDLFKYNKRSLCHGCNTTRSQPYDKAFDKLHQYFRSHYNGLEQMRWLRFDHIFGPGHPAQFTHLLGFFMKQLGCAMVDDGLLPPAEFVALIGSTFVRPFELTITINTTVRDQLDARCYVPPAIGRTPDGGVVCNMAIRKVQYTMWWQCKPHRGQYGKGLWCPTLSHYLKEIA